MPTPFERIKKIFESRTPSEVVFKVTTQVERNSILLTAVKVKESEFKELPEDKDLQDALIKEFDELWDGDKGKYYISSDIEKLWNTVKCTILAEYLDDRDGSQRCAATKRKTENFIRGIKVDDKHLPNYLLQVFLKIRSKDYNRTTAQERQSIFEQFESLRRTYGK